MLIRCDSPGTQTPQTGAEYRWNDRVRISLIRSVIDKCGAQHGPAANVRGREHHVARFLQVSGDCRLQFIIARTIAKANDIQLNRCHAIEQRFVVDRCREPTGNFARQHSQAGSHRRP